MKVRSENSLDYIPVGDYFIPALTLPHRSKPIGKWGRIYQNYLNKYHPVRYSSLVVSGQLWNLLAQVNELVQNRLDRTIREIAADPMAWVGAMNNIRSRAKELVLQELIWEEETR